MDKNVLDSLGLSPDLVKQLHQEGKLESFLNEYQRLIAGWANGEPVQPIREAISQFVKPNGVSVDVLVDAYCLRKTLDPEAMADSSRRQIAENNASWERRLQERIREVRAEYQTRENQYQQKIAELERKVAGQGRRKKI